MSNRKFCIKRTEGNYDIVNDFFNKVYNTKKINFIIALITNK